jgi:hypothetical protein
MIFLVLALPTYAQEEGEEVLECGVLESLAHPIKCNIRGIAGFENEAIASINELIGDFLTGSTNPVSLQFLYEVIILLVAILFKILFAYAIVRMVYLAWSLEERYLFKTTVIHLLLGSVFIFNADIIYRFIRAVPTAIGSSLINSVSSGTLNTLVNPDPVNIILGLIFILLLIIVLLISIVMSIVLEVGMLIFPLTLLLLSYPRLKNWGRKFLGINVFLLLFPILLDISLFIVYFTAQQFSPEWRMLVMIGMMLLMGLLTVKFGGIIGATALSASSYFGLSGGSSEKATSSIRQERNQETANDLLRQISRSIEGTNQSIQKVNQELNKDGGAK